MHRANSLHIRIATSSDCLPLANLRTRLWPESSCDEHARELTAILDGTVERVLPLIIFVAEQSDGALVGFLEAGLRSCADGCDVSRPVGYVEGWFVEQHRRSQGIGRELLRAAEAWARAQGCHEMASDTDIGNKLSQHVHEASGFTIAARAILYRKFL
jgi:aminoglycoside 6'-N-acetyltransferase I